MVPDRLEMMIKAAPQLTLNTAGQTPQKVLAENRWYL
jgi:hypothetical protein